VGQWKGREMTRLLPLLATVLLCGCGKPESTTTTWPPKTVRFRTTGFNYDCDLDYPKLHVIVSGRALTLKGFTNTDIYIKVFDNGKVKISGNEQDFLTNTNWNDPNDHDMSSDCWVTLETNK
jgi:hypothetical protein